MLSHLIPCVETRGCALRLALDPRRDMGNVRNTNPEHVLVPGGCEAAFVCISIAGATVALSIYGGIGFYS